jgi:aspartate aminotransferase
MNFFDNITLAPPDAVFNLNTLFKQDNRKEKVNLGVGAYKTEQLNPWVLPAVRKAEENLIKLNLDHEYLPIEGDRLYNELSLKVIFGENYFLTHENRLCSVQTIGGTSALQLAASLLKKFGLSVIHLPDPTWINHQNIFSQAGLNILKYPYFDIKNLKFLFDELLQYLNQCQEGSAILLHSACHNPSGIDPTKEQWQKILEVVKKRNLYPIFDNAYQGFAQGIDEDAYAIRLFADHLTDLMVTNSFSKNFGLYGQRIGSLAVLANNETIKSSLLSQLLVLVRAVYSNPAVYGARIVKTILGDVQLKKEWENNVREIRSRIFMMRKLLADTLHKKGAKKDFSFIKNQYGMFSFCGLEKDAVDRLINEYAIYMVGNGRISVAGLCNNNVDYVAQAILEVM